ncbi:glycosyltransferase family 1 protein [Thermococcus sp. ES12]|uniref:glycosyltransferase family 4 protein n=3 Tax=unclassified Thermococcus TaxID=2627626 RepID=UPI00143126F7|nr:glycosyltransferase family 1 protein [Thermococcus sp. ES12]NJE77285.1 glycosyltransferase family 1 protein [Thermococcus sp. ES12]
MRVGIVAGNIDNRVTGIDNYSYNLIKNLFPLMATQDIEIIVIHPEDKILQEIMDSMKYNGKSFQYVVKIPKLPFDPQKRLSKFVRKLFIIPTHSKKLRLDLVHDVYLGLFFFYPQKTKKIITIYDLVPIKFPQTHRGDTILAHKYALMRSLRYADKIISISYSTKKDAVKYFKISEEKIRVIHLGVDEDYKLLPENEIKKIKQKYNLNYPFILYVGTLEPRKNIPTLLKALYKLKKQGLPHKLVITGKKGWKYKNIFELISKLNLQRDVIFTGYVPREDLPALYNAADLFVYPSLYEGFGLPPLEAMACGTPVITSNTSSLPEVVGNAGIMVDPYDVNGLAKAIYEVLTNDRLREELRKRGLERAKMFSWKKTAEETLKVYEEVYDSS